MILVIYSIYCEKASTNILHRFKIIQWYLNLEYVEMYASLFY